MTMSMRIISRRCDEPMRRSKERFFTPHHTRWRCTGECKSCICCLEKHHTGEESHVNPNFKGKRIEDD